MHSVKEQVLVMHSFKEQIFFDVECQGAYAGDGYIEFKDRIGKETELKTMQFAGELNKEAIKKIEAAKTYLDDKWYQKIAEF